MSNTDGEGVGHPPGKDTKMSNVKQVHLVAQVPFNYLDDAGVGLRDELLVLMQPSIGLRHRYTYIEDRPSVEHRGVTAWYQLEITGEEALRFSYFNALHANLKSVGAIIEVWDVVDIEDGWS